MKFTSFKFKNFKGIEDQTFSISDVSNIHTLVGLNESGKTTILEAINFFSHKPESLEVLEIDNYEINDIHDLIPINKRDNFNEEIIISANLELDENDINEIKKIVEEEFNGTFIECSRTVSYTQKYYFKNSKHIQEKSSFLWSYSTKIKKKRARKETLLTNEENHVIDRKYLKKNIPSILYFPNFLFELPERIYLEEEDENDKHTFYKKIIQDILDSLNNGTNIDEHIINRIQSDDSNDIRNLNSLKNKMEHRLSETIFKTWNKIFNKEISSKEIKLEMNEDEVGIYIEFYIKDGIDTYRVTERSLGFRWFFVYILLTQFRNYRKKQKNAFFIFDEPAYNLHPSAQTELLKSFENLPNVLYTTHSHYLINPKWLESTYVIKNSAINYNKEEEFISKDTNISIAKYREFASKYPNQSSYFQPILEILDYQPTKLELVPKVVITEGKNDFYTFNYYQETIKNIKRAVIKFVPGTSSSNMSNLISLYLGWGTKFIVLLDSDKAGLSSKEKYLNDFGDILENIIYTYKDIDPKWVNFETEDLLNITEKSLIDPSINPENKKYNKKQFNRALQQKYITNTPIKLNKETESNFATIFKFLKSKLNE